MLILDESEIIKIIEESEFNINKELTSKLILDKVIITRFSKTMEFIPVGNEKDILVEIGCYAPWLSVYKQILQYSNFIAVSYNEWDMLSKRFETSKNGGNIKLKVKICNIEKEKLDIKDSSADVVLLLEVLEHFSLDPMAVMAEINRILKKDGILIVSTPNAISWTALISLLLGKNPIAEPYNGHDTNRHNRLYSPGEIIKLAEASGFTIENLITFNMDDSIIKKIGKILIYIMDLPFLFTRENRTLKHRGQFIIAKMKKLSPIQDRYPKWLYKSYLYDINQD